MSHSEMRCEQSMTRTVNIVWYFRPTVTCKRSVRDSGKLVEDTFCDKTIKQKTCSVTKMRMWLLFWKVFQYIEIVFCQRSAALNFARRTSSFMWLFLYVCVRVQFEMHGSMIFFGFRGLTTSHIRWWKRTVFFFFWKGSFWPVPPVA